MKPPMINQQSRTQVAESTSPHMESQGSVLSKVSRITQLTPKAGGRKESVSVAPFGAGGPQDASG